VRIILLGHSKTKGGAGIAANRISDCLNKNNIDVFELFLDNYLLLKKNFYLKLKYSIIVLLSKIIKKFQISKNFNSHSLNLFGFFDSRDINKIDGEIINLLWINNEVISIKEISKIKKKIIWTILDTWPFCGTEHYTDTNRFVEGYYTYNKPIKQKGIDLEKVIWQKKNKFFKKKNIKIIATSQWLYKLLKKSELFKNNSIHKVNCPIDCDLWKPINKNIAREQLGLDKNAYIIIYGGGLSRARKGFDLLESSLMKNLNLKQKVIVLSIGRIGLNFTNSKGIIFKNVDFQNSVSDQILYHSAADIVSIPSRFDNMPYFGIESMACQTPAIAFDIGGCGEMFEHMKSGWLSRPFDINDYSKGINWLLEDKDRLDQLSINAREYIKNNFSYDNFFKEYKKVLIS
jgi:glycosyltransferase involved in cell wall biosynthesis